MIRLSVGFAFIILDAIVCMSPNEIIFSNTATTNYLEFLRI